jgi:predicted metal-dependent HD superfamily phosphohydrolase
MTALRQHVELRLRGELPLALHYHGPHHTFDDVIPAVERLCQHEGVSPKDRDILLAAAMFHDMGFLECYNGNEHIGARMAAETLPQFGFGPTEISRVRGLILATEMKEVDGVWRQVPEDDPLKRILCDADLDNLGRDDFFSVSDNLRQELLEQGKAFTELEWLTRQVLFVSQQDWFTASQRRERQAGKEKNLATLRRQLAAFL